MTMHGSAEAADEHGASVNMLSAVAVARGACRLRFLTGAAAVCYGVPLAALRELFAAFTAHWAQRAPTTFLLRRS